MPNSMFSLDASFPQFTGGESEKQKVGAIYDYLIQLQQTLRYCLQNLGGDNFNDTELEIIGNTIREPVYLRLTGVESEMSYISLEAGKISARMEDAEGNISQLQYDASGFGSRLEDAEGNIAQLQADATGYSLSVTNGRDSATVSLKAGETVLSSQKIKFEGLVTFTTDDDGFAMIDGGKIYSEQIMSERHYVERLWVKDTNDLMGTRMEWDGINWYVGSVWGTNEDWAYIGYHTNGLLISTIPAGGFLYGMVISAAGDLELKAGEEITIGETGKTIRLNGDVYVNGTKIS